MGLGVKDVAPQGVVGSQNKVDFRTLLSKLQYITVLSEKTHFWPPGGQNTHGAQGKIPVAPLGAVGSENKVDFRTRRPRKQAYTNFKRKLIFDPGWGKYPATGSGVRWGKKSKTGFGFPIPNYTLVDYFHNKCRWAIRRNTARTLQDHFGPWNFVLF